MQSPNLNFRITEISFLSKVPCRHYAVTFMIIHFETIILYKQRTVCITERITPPTTNMCLRFNYQRLMFDVFVVCIVSRLDVLSLLVSVTHKSSCDLVCLCKVVISHLSFLWRFDPIQGQVLPLRGFTVALIRHTTLGRTSQGE